MMEHTKTVYRTNDDLKNFHVKVDLYSLNHGRRGRESPFNQITNPSQQEPETYTFTWQKKVFSKREFEFYGDVSNCSTALENRYNRDITRLREASGRKNNRLFCYVEGDQPNLPPDLLESSHVVPGPHQTHHTFSGSAIRRRHPTRRLPIMSVEDPVVERSRMERRLAHNVNMSILQSMYIMAEFHHTEEAGIETWEEHLLCLIQVDGNGLVSVKPDFNGGNESPYRIETRNRDTYEYHIQQVAGPVPAEYTAQEKKIQAELYHRRTQQYQDLVGTQFSDPPEGDGLSVLLFGEIVSAQGFEYNDLYITAHLQLPEFWELQGTRELSVVTQISRTKSKHLYDIAYFNCPFEYDLVYHNITTMDGDLAHWPCVLVEVCSLDRWERHRLEGYGHLPLPTSPGVHELAVETWRPCGRGVVDMLRRFFVGGATELNDISYITKPADFEGRYLSKYGFQTESSGTVNFKFHIIHHSSCKAQKFQSQQLAQAISRHGGLRTSLAATLDIFQRARQKAASVTTAPH